MNSLWAVTLATLVKDIRLEWRSKDALNSMLFFSLAGGGDLQFLLRSARRKSRGTLSGGLVWIAFCLLRW